MLLLVRWLQTVGLGGILILFVFVSVVFSTSMSAARGLASSSIWLILLLLPVFCTSFVGVSSSGKHRPSMGCRHRKFYSVVCVFFFYPSLLPVLTSLSVSLYFSFCFTFRVVSMSKARIKDRVDWIEQDSERTWRLFTHYRLGTICHWTPTNLLRQRMVHL